MKNLFYFICLLILMSTTCTDQGPLTTSFYVFKNDTKDTIQAVFFSSSPIVTNKVDTIVAKPSKEITLFSVSVDFGGSGAIDVHPNQGDYDSVSINLVSNGILSSMVYYKDSCVKFNNPLCEENYEFSKKEFKDGDVHEIYRFKYKP